MCKTYFFCLEYGEIATTMEGIYYCTNSYKG